MDSNFLKYCFLIIVQGKIRGKCNFCEARKEVESRINQYKSSVLINRLNMKHLIPLYFLQIGFKHLITIKY